MSPLTTTDEAKVVAEARAMITNLRGVDPHCDEEADVLQALLSALAAKDVEVKRLHEAALRSRPSDAQADIKLPDYSALLDRLRVSSMLERGSDDNFSDLLGQAADALSQEAVALRASTLIHELEEKVAAAQAERDEAHDTIRENIAGIDEAMAFVRKADATNATLRARIVELEAEKDRLEVFRDFVLRWVDRGPPHGGPGNEAVVLDGIRNHPVLAAIRAMQPEQESGR